MIFKHIKQSTPTYRQESVSHSRSQPAPMSQYPAITPGWLRSVCYGYPGLLHGGFACRGCQRPKMPYSVCQNSDLSVR
jgi:hypothetical protein